MRRAPSNGCMSSVYCLPKSATCCSPRPNISVMQQVENLLRAAIGLDSAAIGSTLIERAVRLRMKSHGLKKTEDYRRLLETSKPEWDELVESVLVTETWFFRDREPFAAFVRMVLEDWLPAHPD